MPRRHNMSTVKTAQQLNVGDIFFESGYGTELQLQTLTKPQRSDTGQWTWKAKCTDGRTIEYLISEGFEHYGPSIYVEGGY